LLTELASSRDVHDVKLAIKAVFADNEDDD
jgi:hypothetical protein